MCLKKFPFWKSNPTRRSVDLGTQPRYEAPGDLWVENVKNAVINIGWLWSKVGRGAAN